MEIYITEPEIKDKKKIKELFTKVITQNFKDYGFYEKYFNDIKYEVDKQNATLDEYFNNDGKNTYFLIAKNNNKILGTIAYAEPNSDIKKYYKDLKNVPEIKSMYVLPDYQGKGIGTELLNKIINVLQNNNIKEFCLESGYPKAQEFWTKKLGEPVVKIKNRWGAGNDYLIWHCKI